MTQTTTPQKSSVGARQARFGATAALYTIVIIAILVVVNWLAQMPRFNKTFDTTANKRFTLSEETQKVIKGLPQDATISYFDVPSGFSTAQAMLDRYKNLSTKIHVQYIDAQKQKTLALSYGVRTAGTAFVEMGGRREEVKALTEEGITGAFLKVLKGVRNICVVSGSGEHQLDQTDGNGLSIFKTFLSRDNYETKPLTLVDKTAVPSNCNVVIVAGPQSDYTGNEVSALKSYVEGGGRVLFLLDPPLDLGREHISDNTALTDLLSSWGVTADKDLVLEQNPMGQLFGMGPEIPLISNYDSQPIVNDMKDRITGFPVARSLQVKNGDKTTVSKLFSTSDGAVAATHLSGKSVSLDAPDNKKGPFVLGAAGTYNTGNPSNPGRFVVIGNSGFLANSMIPFQGNRDLALNSINWLSSDEDLISIRPKDPEDRRMTANQRQMNIFAYTDLVAIPIMIVVAGIAVYFKRR
jgi:ABC-type uncharacterized transport system involved in gliding motility auxiliary subunit